MGFRVQSADFKLKEGNGGPGSNANHCRTTLSRGLLALMVVGAPTLLPHASGGGQWRIQVGWVGNPKWTRQVVWELNLETNQIARGVVNHQIGTGTDKEATRGPRAHRVQDSSCRSFPGSSAW